MQHLMKLSFVRNRLYLKAVETFLSEREARGILLRNEDTPERLCALRTVLIDDALIMEGIEAVRQVAAPLDACDVQQLKRQSAWMVLTAGIALGCDGHEALGQFVLRQGIAPDRMLRQYPRMGYHAGDAACPVRTYVHRDAGGLRAYAQGEVEPVLSRCTMLLEGRERPMEEADRRRIRQASADMLQAGLRALAFATCKVESTDAMPAEMAFLGLVGLGDLPHPESPWAMEALRGAGVRPVLVCGGPAMAGTVRASGVLRARAGIMEAAEMDDLSDDALREAAEHADAYLGMDWQRKRRLARAMRQDGTVATLSIEPEGGGMVLAIGGGAAPDVVFQRGGARAVVRLLADCRTFVSSYQT